MPANSPRDLILIGSTEHTGQNLHEQRLLDLGNMRHLFSITGSNKINYHVERKKQWKGKKGKKKYAVLELQAYSQEPKWSKSVILNV